MKIGQLVYKYQDSNGKTWYTGTNGLASSTEIVLDSQCVWKPNENIFKNILQNNTITKLGVQAPPGSIIKINGHDFYIGQSGLFEINENISSLYFVNPVPEKNVILDYVYKEGV